MSTSLLLEQAQRREARLKFLPNPDELECAFDSSSICLLTDDGSWLSIQVAQSLIQRGWKVVVLSFPKFVIPESSDWPDAIARVALVDLSEGHLQQQLEAIERLYGSIRAFIHLNPVDVTAQMAKTLLKQVFLIAKHLKKSLNAATQLERSWFVTALHLDGHLGTGKTTEFEPIVGGFLGLTKTLNLEWERVFCRSIDFSRELEVDAIVRSLLAELHDPNRLLVEVGYSRQGRVTLVAEPETMPISAKNVTHPITSDSVFLVSGGGRGITAKCAIQLAQSYPCKFILLGRSSLDPEPIWAQGCLTEDRLKQNAIATLTAQAEKVTPATIQKLVKSVLAQREIAQTLQAIAQAGGQAEYLSVDVTNVLDLQAKLTPVLQRFGKVTGIIHGAGVLADKLIEYKSAADFEVVYTTKIEGLNNILRCVNVEQINHLVLFSSAAGFYGNIGQSDYAIANEILNKFAHSFKRHHPNCQVISFNWGPWESGMVTPELKQLFAQRDIKIITVEAGTQVFVNQLAGNSQTLQVLVGSALITPSVALESDLKNYRIRRKLKLEANPFLSDHAIGNHAVLPTVFATAWLANTAEQLYPGYSFYSCENYKVLKGIVFDETLADEYILDIVDINKMAGKEIEVSAQICSQTKEGKSRYHYQGNLKLLKQIPMSPIYENFDNQQDHELINLFPYQDGTLFHGYSFQGVKRVLNITPKKLNMECILPIVKENYWGQFPAQAFNAIAADIQFQCMLIWVRYFYQAASLPLSCKRGEHFQDIPLNKNFYVSMEVQSSSETKLVANIISHDEGGMVYSRVFGAEVTISKQLNQLFASVKMSPG